MSIREKFTLITFCFIFLAYNLVGYILNVEELKFIVLNGASSIRISFIALIIPVILSYIIYYFTKKVVKR